MTANTTNKKCGMCGQEHGQCFICESICFTDESVERALFIGFTAALGVQLTSNTRPHAVVQLMLGKLCKEHRKLWDELSARTVKRVQDGPS
jgi:hypothetical protein